ncbi:hypothetical protein [Ferrovibrio sp.]|uniref:hypothetical protein n=1 Tax=Ferrovibrio sp. TaxID=1917215 RepID=UPI0025C20279|nr:hypothetical protein [Ferrovibrio sp.]MBX3453057.1 hypothetical protein [Ferrovibrio sp.]
MMMRRPLLLVALLLALAACQRPSAVGKTETKPAESPASAQAEQPRSGGFFSRLTTRRSDPPPVALAEPVKAPARYRHCAECLLDAEGREVPASLAIRGFVENVEQRGNVLAVSGWAADADRKGPPAELLFIARGVVIWRGVPSVTRGDVAQHLGVTNTAVFGYSFEIPLSEMGPPSVLWAIDQAGRAKTLEVIKR